MLGGLIYLLAILVLKVVDVKELKQIIGKIRNEENTEYKLRLDKSNCLYRSCFASYYDARV